MKNDRENVVNENRKNHTTRRNTRFEMFALNVIFKKDKEEMVFLQNIIHFLLIWSVVKFKQIRLLLLQIYISCVFFKIKVCIIKFKFIKRLGINAKNIHFFGSFFLDLITLLNVMHNEECHFILTKSTIFCYTFCSSIFPLCCGIIYSIES